MKKEKILKIFLKEFEEEKNNSILNKKYYFNPEYKGQDGKLRMTWGKEFGNRSIAIRKNFWYYYYPAHSHDYIEMLYVVQGEIEQKILGKNVVLKENQLIFLNPKIEHEIMPCTKENLAVKIFINPQLLKTFYEYISNDNLVNKFFLESIFKVQREKALIFDISKSEEIENLISEIIIDAFEEGKEKFTSNKLKLKVALLITELGGISKEAIEITTPYYEQKLIIDVLSYIETDYKNGKLNEIAEKLNVSNYYLSKLIKANLGTTFKKIVQEKRIEKSCDLLKHSNMTITQIAEEVGYKNWSSFYSVFEEHCKVTPMDYRKCKK